MWPYFSLLNSLAMNITHYADEKPLLGYGYVGSFSTELWIYWGQLVEKVSNGFEKIVVKFL